MKRFNAFMFFIISMRAISCFGQVDLDMAPMEKQENEALYSTIQGFVGDWWNGSDLYPDPCGWTPIQGVSCDLFNGFWYVTVLNVGPIQENSLSCAKNLEFRPHLFQLKHLKALSFFKCFESPHKNPFTIPYENWEELSGTLESLEFRSNKALIGKIPSSFGFLQNLESLVLLENGLTGEIPPQIGNLKKLKRLVISGNYFTGNIPDIFSGLTELLILDLRRNSLSGFLPLSIGNLATLLKLDLSHNKLEGSLLKELSYLKNLTLLDLRSNKFSGGLELSLQEMYSLEEMILSNNAIGGNIMTLKWEKLKNLVILDLSKMKLTGEIPEAISECKKLRFLSLSDNNLTGKILPKLFTIPSLYVSGNNLTGEIKFSKEFYGKMGRRFGAWSNPSLCYQVMSTSYVPYGVKQCKKEIKLVKKSNAKNGDMNMTLHSIASIGFFRCNPSGSWWAFLLEILVMGLFFLDSC